MALWRWMAVAVWLTCVTGCASAPAPERDMEGVDSDQKKSPKDEPELRSREEGGDEYAPKKDPERGPESADKDRMMAPSSGGGAADPRAAVDELARELEGQVGSYREDFGVESGEAEYGRDVVVTCDDICDVKDAICTSSGKICSIAQSYPDDDHIRGRCTWARDECANAEDACTRCR